MKKVPRITVLILTYNRAKLVERSIQSVLRQSFQDFELVLVDNGSTDDTPAIFEKYKQQERIRIFRIEDNIGFARGFNFCLDQIQGEWFATVGDDDEITSDALEVLFNLVDEKDPTLTAVSSNGLDTSTGQNSGLGLYEDQYLPLETIVAKCDGDFWGITKSELIKDKRLNPDIPGMENTLWYKVDAIARRYYTHQQLITYHTDHGERETNKQSADMTIKVKLYKELLTEPFFWEVLRKHNKKQYRDRCIKAMHFLKASGEVKAYKKYSAMLHEDQPGLKYNMHARIIHLLPPGILTRLFYWKQQAG